MLWYRRGEVIRLAGVSELVDRVAMLRDAMVETLMEMVAVRAVNPRSGDGNGEYDRARFLEDVLTEIGFDEMSRYEAPDDAVSEGVRPNLIARKHGRDRSRTLWIVTHMDTVPEGDRSLWETDPYKPVLRDGKIYGRGAEDNGQALVASLYAVKALNDLDITPLIDLGLALVADEETGSRHGISYLIEQGIFGEDDLILVPDAGNEDGSFIEIAEKSILWFKLTTLGKQAHGSTPHEGINAHRVGMLAAIEVDRFLHQKYERKDPLFDPPESTFEPTKVEPNVGNINTMPGRDVVYFDCRILPDYPVEQMLNDIQGIYRRFEIDYGVKIELEVIQRLEAPSATPEDAPVVSRLKQAIQVTRGLEPTIGGIGGGTCAALFRNAGLPAVVWCTQAGMAHQPNEYCVVDNLVADTQVFVAFMIL
ncbi:MAG: M20 family metallo-hydrolase [Candidatus Bipolaricaulia bacterium]